MKALIAASLIILSTSCSTHKADANDAELEAAAETGRRMGEKAAALPANSMQQQDAVLEIRAKESAMREAGFPSCADTFAVEAAKKLGFK